MRKELDFKNNSRATLFLGMVIFIFFAGIYIMPSKIKLISLVFVAGLMLYVLMTNSKLYYDAQFFYWGFYIALGIIVALLMAIAPIADCFEFVVSIGIGMIVSIIAYDKNAQNAAMRALVLLCLLVVLGCVMQYVAPGLLEKINRITLNEEQYEIFYNEFFRHKILVGFSYQTGVTGYYLALFVVLLFCYYMANRDGLKLSYKIFMFLAIFVLFVLLLLTRKRGELLVTFVLLAILLCFYERKHSVRLVGIILFIGIAATILLFATEVGRGILERTFGENPTSGRSRIYAMLFSHIKHSPLWGYGFSSVLILVTEFTNGHNIYIQTMAETGIIGLILLLTILISNLYKAYKVLNYESKINKDTYIAAVSLAFQLHFIFTGMFGNPLYDIYPLVLYMLTVGLIQSKYHMYLSQQNKNIIIGEKL